MGRVEEFLEAHLSHGKSRYDPVKAHEYYLRTRELKGRRSTSELKGNKKKEAWAYTKDQVQKERKESLIDAAENKQQAVAQLREKAQERREELREKLRDIMESLTDNAQTSRERISNQVDAAIAALPKMPEGLSKEDAAKFAAKRREEIARIRGEAKESRTKLGEETKSVRGVERGKMAEERVRVATELKSSVDSAREKFKVAREAIKAKYETELDREYESIRANV